MGNEDTVSVKLTASKKDRNTSPSTDAAHRDGTSTSSTSAAPTPTASPRVVGTPSQPCLVSGLYSAFSAGVLGFFFGAIPSMAKNRTFAARGLWAADGGKSAQALALVSGMYTWIHCLCQRIRLKEDGYNRGAAGCATGLVLGWKGGPSSALQSCAGFGLISYILDFGGGNSNTPPANAAMMEKGFSGSCPVGLGLHGGQQQALRGLRKGSICDSQGLELESGGPASIVSAAQQAGGRVGKLNKQWWQRQQRQRQQQLPPVVWLAQAMQPGYFKA